jgi:hypothetical protein
MSKTTTLIAWASVPPALWMALIAVGLVASASICESTAAFNAGTAVLFAVSVAASLRAMAVQRRTDPAGPGLPGKVVVLVAILFTAGIALTWVMVAVAPCA